MTFSELDSLECRCGHGKVERVPGMPQTLRCKKCGGWCAIHAAYITDIEKLREVFKQKPLDE